jgi:hypothetical protein
LFDWLVTGQVVPVNPAASVRGPRHDPSEARALHGRPPDNKPALLSAILADGSSAESRANQTGRSRGNSTDAIVNQIVDAKAQFRSLAEPWADTGTSTGRLMIAVLSRK